MEVIFSTKATDVLPPALILTIGNFDGVHRGHRELITRVKESSFIEKIPGGLLTFDPHPISVLAPQKKVQSLFDLQDRIDTVQKLGLDFFIVEEFNRQLSELSPEVFFQRYLIEKYKVKKLIVGHDFYFGKNREGTPAVLKDLCSKARIPLEIVPPVKVNGEVVSSSRIREAIIAGDVEKTILYLGRPFYLKGVIEKGQGRGHKLGFPTANLFSSSELFPRNGVYLTTFETRNKEHRSLTNVGVNPTFETKNRRPLQVETFILDFKDDIYGESARISFLKFLRPEIKFTSVDLLIEQMSRDVEAARSFNWPQN